MEEISRDFLNISNISGDTFNYNYIIFGSDGYYLAGYRDIIGLENVKYLKDCYDGFGGKLSKIIVRLNFSKAINKYVNTPFRRYVFPKLSHYKFDNDKPICYIFFGIWHYLYNSTFPEYVKKLNPNNKCVLYLQDLVSKNRFVNIEQLRGKMDVLISYDQGDCNRYGMFFYPTPMSRNLSQVDNTIGKSDFYYCGMAKGRFNLVHTLFRELTERGYNCDFNILGLPYDIEKVQGIHYLEKPLDYQENLAHVKNTRCVVEIMQDGADGFTPRLWESIINDRHLLSNNYAIEHSPYFNPDNIHLIPNQLGSMDCTWVEKEAFYSVNLKNSLSPINLLRFIDQKLSEQL